MKTVLIWSLSRSSDHTRIPISRSQSWIPTPSWQRTPSWRTTTPWTPIPTWRARTPDWRPTPPGTSSASHFPCRCVDRRLSILVHKYIFAGIPPFTANCHQLENRENWGNLVNNVPALLDLGDSWMKQALNPHFCESFYLNTAQAEPTLSTKTLLLPRGSKWFLDDTGFTETMLPPFSNLI